MWGTGGENEIKIEILIGYWLKYADFNMTIHKHELLLLSRLSLYFSDNKQSK